MLHLLRTKRLGIAVLALCTALGGLLPLAQHVCAMAMAEMAQMEDCCCEEEATHADPHMPAPAVHLQAETASGLMPCQDHCFDAHQEDLVSPHHATLVLPVKVAPPNLVVALSPPEEPRGIHQSAPLSEGSPPGLIPIPRHLLFSTLLC